MLYIGIDLGTSAVKLLLMDASGAVLNTVSRSYPLSFPHPGWSEQDPRSWREAVLGGIPELLRGFDASAVAGMPMLDRIPHGFRSRRHPLVLKLMSSGDMIWEKTLFSVLFVPSPDMFTYRSSLPDIGELMASSTAALSELLQRINARSWNADPYTVISWSDETKDEGRKVLSGLVPDSESTIDGESAAKFAYSVLYRALMFSLSGGTPLIIGRVGRKNGRSKGRSKGMHSTEEE